VLDVVGCAPGGPGLGDVGRAVVAHDLADGHPAVGEPRDGSFEERDGRDRAFVGEHLDVGETSGVVDTDVHGFPTSPSALASGAVSQDSFAGAAEPAEFLDIHVHELAGMAKAVAVRWFGWSELPPSIHAQTLEDHADGRHCHLERRGDLGAGPTQPAEAFDLAFDSLGCACRSPVRRRGSVDSPAS
jgi:hypothetical protein